VWLPRTGVSGELGYELFCRPETRRTCCAGCCARPARGHTGCRPSSRAAIEAGVIVTDTDYPEHTYTPFEVLFDRLVDLRRDFLGRDGGRRRGHGARAGSR
jgi:glycine cleavage system aminomethyltransferase T